VEVGRQSEEQPKRFLGIKNKTCLGDIQKEDGSLTSDDHEKAKILSKFFTIMFTREDTFTSISEKHSTLFLIGY